MIALFAGGMMGAAWLGVETSASSNPANPIASAVFGITFNLPRLGFLDPRNNGAPGRSVQAAAYTSTLGSFSIACAMAFTVTPWNQIRISDSGLERFGEFADPPFRDAANDQMAASAAGPPGERKIAPALRANWGVRRVVSDDA